MSEEERRIDTSALCDRLESQIEAIRACESRHGRQPGSVRLLAVSKTKPVEAIAAAYACGQRLFGENYAQELEAKASALALPDLEWHFIGPIQSNKTRIIATHADWVHSIDRLKTASRLSAQRPGELPPLQVCLQVNIDGEASKSGVDLESLPELCASVSELPNIRVRGLMCIPRARSAESRLRQQFARMREARDALNAEGYSLDTLSMGMSADFQPAIAEGATIVRIGTAIFGARE